MGFKRSAWWGLAGAVVVSAAYWFIAAASDALSNAETHFFVFIGLNPREQRLLCVVLSVAVTSVIGFVGGRGLQFCRP
jgi:hypothetical protein